MKILEGKNAKLAEKYIKLATAEAKKATCRRAKCGAVLIKNGKPIGAGHNSPPLNDEDNRMCDNEYDFSKRKKLKYDVTCCVHAEWRALMDAIRSHPKDVKKSSLYFMRIEDGQLKTTQPFCTVCSRLLMDAGVKEVVLWQNEGLVLYDASAYNQASYVFFR